MPPLLSTPVPRQLLLVAAAHSKHFAGAEVATQFCTSASCSGPVPRRLCCLRSAADCVPPWRTSHTDFETAGKLPGEEAALYECVRLNVCDVAAYVADGEFDWQASSKARWPRREVSVHYLRAG